MADNRYQEAIETLATEALSYAEVYVDEQLHSEHQAAVHAAAGVMQRKIRPDESLIEAALEYLKSHEPDPDEY